MHGPARAVGAGCARGVRQGRGGAGRGRGRAVASAPGRRRRASAAGARRSVAHPQTATCAQCGRTGSELMASRIWAGAPFEQACKAKT